MDSSDNKTEEITTASTTEAVKEDNTPKYTFADIMNIYEAVAGKRRVKYILE